jgi:hypothetical protein
VDVGAGVPHPAERALGQLAELAEQRLVDGGEVEAGLFRPVRRPAAPAPEHLLTWPDAPQ